MKMKNLTITLAMLAASCAANAQSVVSAFDNIISCSVIDVACIKNERITDPMSKDNRLKNVHRVYEFKMKSKSNVRYLIAQAYDAINHNPADFYRVEEKNSARQHIPGARRSAKVEYTDSIEPQRMYYGTELESEMIGTLVPTAKEAKGQTCFAHHIISAYQKDAQCPTCRYNYTLEWFECGGTIRGRLYVLYAVLPDLGIGTAKPTTSFDDDEKERVAKEIRRTMFFVNIQFPKDEECSAIKALRDIARREGVEDYIFYNGAVMLGSLLSEENGRDALSHRYTPDEICEALYSAAHKATTVQDAYASYKIAGEVKAALYRDLDINVKVKPAADYIRERFGEDALNDQPKPAAENKDVLQLVIIPNVQIFDIRPIRIDKADKYLHAQQNATIRMSSLSPVGYAKGGVVPCFSYVEECGAVEAFVRKTMREHGIETILGGGGETLDLKSLKAAISDPHAYIEQLLSIHEEAPTVPAYYEGCYLLKPLVECLFSDDAKSQEYYSRRIFQRDEWRMKHLKREQLGTFSNRTPLRRLWFAY